MRIASPMRLIDCLNNCGHLCAATSRWADAVTMWAAFVACLKEIGMTDRPAAQERRREPLRRAEQALGPDRTRAAEQRGRDMTLATATELAILLAGADTGADAQAPAAPDLGQLNVRERELVILVAQGRTMPRSPGSFTSACGPSAPGWTASGPRPDARAAPT